MLRLLGLYFVLVSLASADYVFDNMDIVNQTTFAGNLLSVT